MVALAIALGLVPLSGLCGFWMWLRRVHPPVDAPDARLKALEERVSGLEMGRIGR